MVIDADLTSGRIPSPTFYSDDGFSFPISVASGNHADTTYHVVRMDRNLNLMWKTDIETDYVSFFITDSNQIFAFASYWSPKREAYLLSFGSEDEFEVISHTMTHHAARTATCTAEGQIEHWVCSDCGGYFADAEGANAITAASVVLPKAAHVPQAYANVAPTCTKDGSTGGTYCGVCRAELTSRTVVPGTGHTPVTDPAVEPTCTTNGSTEGAHCSVCRAELTPQTPIAAKEHTKVIDQAVAPTYEKEGLTEGAHCSVCNQILVAQQTIAKLQPETTVPSVEETTAPPIEETTAPPVEETITPSVEETSTPSIEETTVPCTEETTTSASESQASTSPEFSPNAIIITIAAVAVAAAAIVIIAIIIKKRK